MREDGSLYRIEDQCDGCGKLDSAEILFPVGDGSIHVCADCYSIATAMVLTAPDTSIYAELR